VQSNIGKDIEKLLNARRKIAGDPPISLKSVTEKVRAENDYSIVIQEYFQARVSDFLENYANARFEFAKIGGQIQMHNCSGYCLYHQKNIMRKLDKNSSDVSKKRKSFDEIQPAISTAKKNCQFGAGHEEHVGVGDTPGFECGPNP
jgi:hypothetical protein